MSYAEPARLALDDEGVGLADDTAPVRATLGLGGESLCFWAQCFRRNCLSLRQRAS